MLPSITAVVLPWLGLLALLTLRPNRHGAAWLILVPCILVAVAGAVLRKFLGEEEIGALVEAMASVSFGLSAAWLAAAFLASRGKALRSLLQALAVAGLTLLHFRGTETWEQLADNSWSGFLYLAVVLCVLYGLVWSSVFIVTGLWCKKRFTLWKVWFGLPFLLFAGWLCASALSTVVAWAAFNESPDWAGLPKAALGLCMASYIAALPLLILSSLSPWYRERLQQLLGVAQSRRDLPQELAPEGPASAAAIR